MFRSKTSMQQHKKVHFPSYMQTIGAVHDNSYHPSPSSQPREPMQPSYFQAIQPSFLSTTILHDSSLSSSSFTHTQPSQPSFSPHLECEHGQVDEKVTKQLTHVEIKDEQGNVLRTQKISIKDVAKHKAGEKVLVPFNEFDQPIRAVGGLCTRYMTLLLKQPNICPPEARDWKELKTHCGVRLMAELQQKFNLPHNDNVERVIFAIFDDKFRTLKHNLKLKLFELAAEKLNEGNDNDDHGERNYNEEELLEALDLVEVPFKFAATHQWELYKSHLRTSKSKTAFRECIVHLPLEISFHIISRVSYAVAYG